MRPPPVILITLAVLGVLATLALGKVSSGSWPCCDDCGVCNKKFPPECQCDDVSARGCHPECKTCVKNIGIQKHPVGGPGPVVTYHCADMLTNFCEHRCTPAPAPPLAG